MENNLVTFAATSLQTETSSTEHLSGLKPASACCKSTLVSSLLERKLLKQEDTTQEISTHLGTYTNQPQSRTKQFN